MRLKQAFRTMRNFASRQTDGMSDELVADICLLNANMMQHPFRSVAAVSLVSLMAGTASNPEIRRNVAEAIEEAPARAARMLDETCQNVELSARSTLSRYYYYPGIY